MNHNFKVGDEVILVNKDLDDDFEDCHRNGQVYIIASIDDEFIRLEDNPADGAYDSIPYFSTCFTPNTPEYQNYINFPSKLEDLLND